MPAEVSAAWDRLRAYLTEEDPRLAFWAEWYRRMLDCEPMGWAMQEEIALIPDDDWQVGPDRIAERRRSLIDTLTKRRGYRAVPLLFPDRSGKRSGGG